MNILNLLKKDHVIVKKILSDIFNTTARANKKREKLFNYLKKELQDHEEIEENILYPIFKNNNQTKNLILESYEEHHVVDLILSELSKLAVSDESWLAKIKVLKENLYHHIKEEEKSLFPSIEKISGKEKLMELGKKMLEMKKSLK